MWGNRIGLRWVWRYLEHDLQFLSDAVTASRLNEGVAAVRRLVDRGIEEAGAPEGALRTATIKYRCKYLSDGHLCDFNYHQATKPDH
ncbi:hypothetical protein D9M71_470440 [compost metagenome]